MNVMEHLRSVEGSNELFDRIIELYNMPEGESFDDLSEQERLQRGAELANCWERIADECERSRATRWLYGRWTPEQMRADAAQFRLGRDPNAD